MIPGSAEWNRLVTASKVAAILGVSPWESPYSMWRRMRGDLPPEPQTDAQGRGHYLEPAILAWWRDQHPEAVSSVVQPEYTLGDWAAATPDLAATVYKLPRDLVADYDNSPHPDSPAVLAGSLTSVLVEAKSTAYDDDWGDPGTDVIPPYYLVQVQFQMGISGIHKCYVPVIGPRLKFAEYVVSFDPVSWPLLLKRCKDFYDSLTADTPPPLDDTVATFNAVRKVHKDIEAGETVEVDAWLGYDLVVHTAQAKKQGAALRLAKSQVIEQMGRAQYATRNGVRIARRQPRGEDVSFVVTAKPADLTAPEGDTAA